jgi:hypothetical protein
MTKTLKDLFEVYRPKAKGEQDFVDKHVAIKHKDRNGNKDDVFKATNVKTVDRETEHGYNPGNDEKVYEGVIGNLAKNTKELGKLAIDSVVGKGSYYKPKFAKPVKQKLKHSDNTTDVPRRDKHGNIVEGLTRESIELGIKEYFAELGEEISAEDLEALVEGALEEFTQETPKANIFEHNFKEKRKSKADIVSSIVEKYAIIEENSEEDSEEHELIAKLAPYLSESAIAKVLELYEQLDEENQEELFDMIETKEGINELLNFMIESSYSEKNDEVEEEE